MKREFLEGLGLEKAVVDQILDAHSREIGREKQRADQFKEDLDKVTGQLADRDKDMEALKVSAAGAEDVKKQLDALQQKYNTETEAYKSQIAERDYMEAVNSEIADLKFSSKSAKSAFVAALKAKALEVKDGKLTGFAEYLTAQREADPEAFAADKPGPMVRPVGTGTPPAAESKGAMYAKQFNAQYTPTQKKE